jgi:hypothetical protein
MVGGERIYLGFEVRRSLSRIGCNVVVMAKLGFASGHSLSPRLHESAYEDYLGLRGLNRSGTKKWRKHVATIVKKLKTALKADYVVLGGGNSKKLKKLPAGAWLGNNRNAFLGGIRMWQK